MAQCSKWIDLGSVDGERGRTAGCRKTSGSCYSAAMSDQIDALERVLPSASPSEEDVRAWEALSRDEQLRLLRAALSHPDCAQVSAATMSEILAEARRRADARSRG